MSHLFATTDLEKSYRVNVNVIGLDLRPQVKGLRDLLAEWLEFRLGTVTKRLQFRRDRIEQRLHILDGLLVAYLNLDEVIRIVREEEHPKAALMERFSLSELQANAILDLRLRQLARLEQIKLESEKAELEAERADIDKILGSRARLKKLVKQELDADARKYGDDRRSPLGSVEAAVAFTDEDLLTTEPVTVVLSTKGWVRAAKGHDVVAGELSYRTGDEFMSAVRGRSNELLVFLDSTGRAYSVAPHTLPSARGQGEPLTGRLTPPDGSRFVGLVMGTEERAVLIASNAGYGFVARLKDLVAKNRAGKSVLSVPKGAVALAPAAIGETDGAFVVAATDQGRMLAFPLAELPELARGKGVKLINVPSAAFKSGAETMIAAVVVSAKEELHVRAGQRYLRLKLADIHNYVGTRAQRGHKLPRGFQKVDGLEVVSG